MQAALDLLGEYGRIRDIRGSRPVCRYAPSPSGPLHLGNARTALLAWLQARLSGALFILRMEDLDRPRTRPGAASAILDDLAWLGLDWDEGGALGGPAAPYDQASRTGLYRRAFDLLREQALLFPCFCSRKDIAQAASAPHAGDGSHLYPGTCRDLPPAESARAGKKPAWRYRVPDRTIAFRDGILGRQATDLAREAGDFVVKRADDLFAYQLAVVVDDALMGVSDVLRGADLLAASALQIELYEALGFAVPRFWHVPLMCDAAGKRLAKRDGAESIQAFRTAGGTPAALVGCLAASLGLVPAGREIDAATLCRALDPATFVNALQRAGATPS